jgi:predicted ATPase
LANWKNFKNADVELSKRTFVVGPNASGKSNFLDAFRFLHDLARDGGGLQSAVALRKNVSAIRSLSARRNPQVGIKVRLGNNDRDDVWTYELRFSQNNNRVPQVSFEEVKHFDEVIITRPTPDDETDSERLTQTFLEQVNTNRQFRDISEFFGSIRYLHVVPQLIREPDRSVGKRNDPFGGDFLEQLAATPKHILESRLERIRSALKIAVPQLAQLDVNRDDRGTAHLRGRYEHWRPDAGWQTEDQFSDGTLRLLGLLWAILDGTGPLLLEEPELSLNTNVVKRIPEIIYKMQRKNDRQVLLSTHSGDMFVDSGVSPEEVLVITPAEEGSSIRIAALIAEVRNVLAANENLSEAVMPLVAPRNLSQLPLFYDLAK